MKALAPHHERLAAAERRLQLATVSTLPGDLAAGYTIAEMAVLEVIAREAGRGACALRLEEIADMASTCSRIVSKTIGQAAAAGLLSVEHRRRDPAARHRAGRRQTSSLIRLASPAWIAARGAGR